MASFRREEGFLPFGGPDGGDGGKGGDIYFIADSNMEDLSTFKHKTLFFGLEMGEKEDLIKCMA